ncbi:MAG: hypothetical protein CFE26_03185 [Verrucomicrobiales bacterium VVV1]|nr:MAG: hypothetical protein CFE26_03185 [Verrucomicrobiales bacterium VVV1]
MTPLLSLATPLLAEPSAPVPLVWVFNGIPGDDPHKAFYEKNLAGLKMALRDRHGIPEQDIRMFYGPENSGYAGICTRERVFEQCKIITSHSKKAGARPVWVILMGHANNYPGGAMFNLAGPDISAKELGAALADVDAATPMTVWITTTCGGPFLKELARPGRIICSASSLQDAENETEFSHAFVGALADRETDANKDGFVSVTELFVATNARVLQTYEQGGFIVKEHAQLDGDGDGRGTSRPAAIDADPASRRGLSLMSGSFQ